MQNAQYLISGVSTEIFRQLHDLFMPATIILSHQWCTATQLFDIEISDKSMLCVQDGNIAIIYKDKSYTINHDDYVTAKLY